MAYWDSQHERLKRKIKEAEKEKEEPEEYYDEGEDYEEEDDDSEEYESSISPISSLVVGMVTLMVVLAVGGVVLSDFQETINVSTTSNVSTGEPIALLGMTEMFSTVGTLAVAAVLIALVVSAFVIRR